MLMPSLSWLGPEVLLLAITHLSLLRLLATMLAHEEEEEVPRNKCFNTETEE